jgi:Domain of unknown function (DUF4174)
MQSLTVLVVLLSLLQGCASPQPFIVMSDLPNSPHSQSLEATNVAASPDRFQEIEFKLSNYQWQHRVLLVFAPSTGSANYRQQMQLWEADVTGTDALLRRYRKGRDLKLVQILETGESQVDGRSLSSASAERLRQQFGITPEEFAVILVGKDGTERQRSQTPIDLTALFRTIDAMPMRQQEMRSRQ